MTELPEWWVQWTGLAAVFVVLASLAVIIGMVVFLLLALGIRREIVQLSGRIQGLVERVDGIAKQVESVTKEVGARTTGIVRTVDDIAAGAFNVIEKYAPILLGIGIILKLTRLFGKK
ncbi:MAG: hypothetical protein IH944_01480 [Armatimonadetes bacterium]|nr:hypothetical protein [Armatimonadota bacterium]